MIACFSWKDLNLVMVSQKVEAEHGYISYVASSGSDGFWWLHDGGEALFLICRWL